MTQKIERRTTPIESVKLELREDPSKPTKIEGYAAVFNANTNIDTWYGSFTESIRKGAFSRAIADKQNVRSVFNHDPNFLLGTVRSGSLTLREDDQGLWSEVTPSLETSVGRDVLEWVRRREVTGMSFAFFIKKQEWSRGDPKKNELDHREILDVDLFDASPVVFPAYEQTSVGVRSKNDPTALLYEEVRSAWAKEPEEPVIIEAPKPSRGVFPEVILVKVSALRRRFAA